MRLAIRHCTHYRFDRPQARIVQLGRLTPPSLRGQTVSWWDVDVDCDARLRTAVDGYGNELTMIYVDGPLDGLTVTATGEVVTQDTAGVVDAAGETLPPEVFLRPTDLTTPDADIAALAARAGEAGDAPLARLHALNRSLGEVLRFDTGQSDVTLGAAGAIARGHGVCQDFAHVFVAGARALDLPARYVSGHLFRSDGASEQPAAHAWAEAWIADLGWVGFDPANAISPDDAYVRVAVGLDYREAAPIAGARVGGGGETLDVLVSVVRAGG